MNIFQLALLFGAIAATAASWKPLPRAKWIIALMTVMFILPTAYSRFGGDMPALIVAMCDISIIVLIICIGKDAWEDKIAYIFFFSALTSVVELTGFGWPHWFYVLLLEGWNWAALALITVTAKPGWVGHVAKSLSPRLARGIDNLSMALRRESKIAK